MIFYPLSVLMLADIREILIISNPENLPQFKSILSTGTQWGLKISYAEQKYPEGIPDAFLIGESFIGKDSVCLVLGDNFFYGQDLSKILQRAMQQQGGATIFGHPVKYPERFGIVQFDENFKVISLEEKPIIPKSNYAITGLYFYDNNVVRFAKQLSPSKRGELEVTDLNQIYLSRNELNCISIEKGFKWLDTGTYESLFAAGQFVQTLECNLGIKIACLEEIAMEKKWISIPSLNSGRRIKMDNIHF